jgi:shikimate kinase/3-dehydroquinate synthase
VEAREGVTATAGPAAHGPEGGIGSLVLVGFMGSGKSTTARAAGNALAVEPVDADQEFERRYGPIPAFFAEHGEAAFRAREEELVLELLEHGGILALGGGAVQSDRVRAALRDRRVMWIDADLETCWQRVRHSSRPLARNRGDFVDLFFARRPLYEEVADVVVPAQASVEAVLDVLRRLPADARMVWAQTAGGAYPVIVGHGVRDVDPGAPGRAVTVSDEHVAGRWAPGAQIVIPAGEQHKTLATAERVWRALAQGDTTRGDHVRAVGGGVVGDLAGFCAATYQRGIAVVQVPTTVVAQVDAAIGGKTGVDLPEGKNYVGAYHQPHAVLADLDTLETLPGAEHAAGYAEVVKTALIAGGRLWERVAAGAPVDAEIVFACARTKVGVVAADERDGGRRQVLNLGHTVAHALETVTGYARLRHGEAVGLGLLAALRLSGLDDLREQVRGLLQAAGLPVTIDAVDPDAVVAATRRDKKRTGDRVPFVLVHAPGRVVHGQDVADGDVRAAVEELLA